MQLQKPEGYYALRTWIASFFWRYSQEMSNGAMGRKLSSCGLHCHCPLTCQIRHMTWGWVSFSMGQSHHHLRRLPTHNCVMQLRPFPLAPTVHRHSPMCHVGTILSLPLSSTINTDRWCGIKDTCPYKLYSTAPLAARHSEKTMPPYQGHPVHKVS